MRLGVYPAKLTPGTKAAAVYGQEVIRAPSPPLRVQQPVPPDARGRRHDRPASRPTAASSRSSSSGTTLVRGQPVPPGVPVAPDRPHPLFDGFVAASLAVRDGREPVFAARPAEEPRGRSATATDADRVRPERLTRSRAAPVSLGLEVVPVRAPEAAR